MAHLLLRVAGHAPDDTGARARQALAQGRVADGGPTPSPTTCVRTGWPPIRGCSRTRDRDFRPAPVDAVAEHRVLALLFRPAVAGPARVG